MRMYQDGTNFTRPRAQSNFTTYVPLALILPVVLGPLWLTLIFWLLRLLNMPFGYE